MLNPWDRLKTWLAVSVGWSFKGKVAEAIRGFQATEADGVWHLHRGMRLVDDPKKKAILFTHSLEEEAHAEAFAHTYREYSDRVMTPAAYERADLYQAHEPPWKIFAYVHVGEQDATARFRYIHRTLKHGPLKSALGKIVADEEGHVDLTREMLIRMGATESDIRAELFRIRLRRAWEQWLRTGKRVIDTLATLLLSVFYFVVGPLLFTVARRKLTNRLVEYDNNRLKRL